MGAFVFLRRRFAREDDPHFVAASLNGHSGAVWCFAALIALAMGVTSLAFTRPVAVAAEDIVIEGRVCLPPVIEEGRTTLTLNDVSLGGEAHGHRLRVYVYEEAAVELGARVAMRGDTWLPSAAHNPGAFDFPEWLWRQDILLGATAKSGTLVRSSPGPDSFAARLQSLRERLGARIDALYPDNAALVRALLLGDKSALPDELAEDFRLAGAAHLLAVSGLHIGCLALAVDWLLRFLRCPRAVSFGIVLAFLLFYAALTGFPSSIRRAVCMFALTRAGPLLGRPCDALNNLAAAFLLLLGLEPTAIADVGFQLSFAAVAGLLLCGPTLSRAMGLPHESPLPRSFAPVDWAVYAGRCLRASLAVSVAAQLGTLPLVACAFHGVGLWAPVTNLFAIPLTMAALPLAMLSLPLGPWAAWLPDLLLRTLTQLVGVCARWPCATLPSPLWPVWLGALFTILAFCASPYLPFKEGTRRLALAALPGCLALALAMGLIARPKGLSLAFLDAGQGDSALVFAEGEVYAVDAGREASPTRDALGALGIGRLRGLFLTHPHADHVGGLRDLLEGVEVETIYLPACWNAVEAEADAKEVLANAGVPIVYLAAGDELALSEGVRATVCAPAAAAAPRNGNEISLVLRLSYGEGSALLTGDAPLQTLDWQPPDSDLVKVPHHGAADSLGVRQICALAPSVAVVSVGRNTFGHPSEALITELRKRGAAVYRTDERGMVLASVGTDGTVSVKTWQ